MTINDPPCSVSWTDYHCSRWDICFPSAGEITLEFHMQSFLSVRWFRWELALKRMISFYSKWELPSRCQEEAKASSSDTWYSLGNEKVIERFLWNSKHSLMQSSSRFLSMYYCGCFQRQSMESPCQLVDLNKYKLKDFENISLTPSFSKYSLVCF